MIAVALVLGAGGALLINRIVERVHDRLLEASTRAVADTVAVDRGRVTLDLPPAAFGMLENDARDNVYYSVTAPQGLVTGYDDLPVTPSPALGGTQFRYLDYRDRRVRIASEARRLPRIEGLVVVQVAETLDARHALAAQLLLALGALEISIIALTALLVPAAVRWGLRPLRRIEAAADARGAEADFTPLPIEQAPAEVRRLIGAFNALLLRLDAAVDGLRRFTADASHQLRTPVAVMRTNIGLLDRMITEPSEGRERIADLDASATRLQRLLEQLLALSRAENAVSAATRSVDLVELSRQIAMDHAPRALAAGQDLDFVAQAPRLDGFCDPLLTTEIISNLLDNAIRYAGSGAMLTVRVTKEGEEISISVSDDGPGVAPDRRQRLTERFYRAIDDEHVSGSGLGLSIAKQLAHAMNGRLEIRHGDVGLTAVLHLPCDGEP